MELNIPKEVRDKVLQSYGRYFSGISKIDSRKIVDDVLSFEKPHEQIAILKKFYPDIKGKKLLEVGSGFGSFLVVARYKYNIDAYGVEPSSEGFDDSFSIAKKILSCNGVESNVMVNGSGEALPFPDNSFDVCYSSNVLEHVDDPKKVITEMIRVTKPGGIIQVIVPNYGSFFEGHYAMFYAPYQPKWFWKLWIEFISGRDSSFADTLRTDLNYFSLRRMVASWVHSGEVEVLSWGDEVFRSRMRTAVFSDWAGLGRVKVLVDVLQKLGISLIVGSVLSFCKAFTPIILTMRKKR